MHRVICIVWYTSYSIRCMHVGAWSQIDRFVRQWKLLAWRCVDYIVYISRKESFADETVPVDHTPHALVTILRVFKSAKAPGGYDMFIIHWLNLTFFFSDLINFMSPSHSTSFLIESLTPLINFLSGDQQFLILKDLSAKERGQGGVVEHPCELTITST